MSERDPFKVRLRRRDVMFGCFVGQPSPAIAEMVGYAGFDYVIVDLEHGPTGLETLENMLRAAQAAGAASLVRLPSPAQADILRVLDAGADGILVPHVESPADARAVVAHAYYPPAGQRGISTVSRAARHAIVSPQTHLAGANARTAVMLMVESPGAVEAARPDHRARRHRRDLRRPERSRLGARPCRQPRPPGRAGDDPRYRAARASKGMRARHVGAVIERREGCPGAGDSPW